MRTMIGTLAIVGMLALGAGLARAQDATMMAMQAAQTANQMAMQAAQQANQNAMQAMMNGSMSVAVALPVTPRPVFAKLKGGVSVALYDADPKAILFYTVEDLCDAAVVAICGADGGEREGEGSGDGV